jgi:hypothetical protein
MKNRIMMVEYDTDVWEREAIRTLLKELLKDAPGIIKIYRDNDVDMDMYHKSQPNSI